MEPQQGFLIVEDEAAFARSLARHFRKHRPTDIVHTLSEARHALGSGDYIGVILDLRLPDGFGLDLLTQIREAHEELPVLVLTGEFNREVVNRVQALRAEYVCKPATSENLTPFIDRAMDHAGGVEARVVMRVDDMVKEWSLTRRERALLLLSVEGLPRRELANRLGVAENTVKAQTRSLLKKSGARSLATLAQQVLKRASR